MSNTTISSGLKTADGVIKSGRGLLVGVSIIPAAADATVTLYDSATAASGKVLFKGLVKASTASVTTNFTHPVFAQNGVFLDIDGVGAAAIIYAG